MMPRRRWGDAERAATQQLRGRESDRRTLRLLARLPLLWAGAIARLDGLCDRTGVYRGLARLRDAGLIAVIRPALGASQAPQLWYPTDLGLATIALEQGVEPESLARHNGVRGTDLLGLLPGLPDLLASYDRLAALAAGRLGRPQLLAWERPWRRRYPRPTAKALVSVAFPAYAALAWAGHTSAYLLSPDRGTIPLRLYRATLSRLFEFRVTSGSLPTLAIATQDSRRVAAWEDLLGEVAQARLDAPPPAQIATWNALHSIHGEPGQRDGDPASASEPPRHRSGGRPPRRRNPRSTLPRIVGEALARPATGLPADDALGRVALQLTASDRELLDLIGRHPFLPAEGLAIALGWTPRWARQRRSRLMARGLVRLVGEDEVGVEPARWGLAELTATGLTLVAAQQGLSLAMAVRLRGLAGGGPGHPVGVRRSLLKHLRHTVGADAVFLGLIARARRLTAQGGDEALIEWRNSVECSRGRVRPDGPGPEDHIARAVWAAGVGREPALPVLLTTIGRVARDHDGLLGAIWREPGTRARRGWPLAVPSAHATPLRTERPLPLTVPGPAPGPLEVSHARAAPIAGRGGGRDARPRPLEDL